MYCAPRFMTWRAPCLFPLRRFPTQAIETRENTMDLDLITEKLNQIVSDAVEYETEHKDAASNYAHLVAESWHSEQEERLTEYMLEKGVDWSGLEIDVIADSVLEQFDMESGHIWGMGSGAYLIMSFPVTEIEISVNAEDLGIDSITKELCESLSRSSDAFCRFSDRDTLFAYQSTDSVWDVVISEDKLRAIVAMLRES